MRFKLLVVIACLCLCASLTACSRGARTSQTNASNANAPADGNAGLPQLPDAAAYVALGNDLYQKDQDEKAIAAYQQALKLDPDYAEAYLKLGLTYRVLGASNDELLLEPIQLEAAP